MFELIYGFLDVRQGQKHIHRVLTVGDEADACASIAQLLSQVHDFKTVVVEVEGPSLPGDATPSRANSLSIEDPYVARVPLECVFPEIHRRNWYRGHIFDFFTPVGNNMGLDDASDVTIISGVHVIVYVTSYSKYRTGFRSAVGFFRQNQGCAACKFLVIDVSSALHTEYDHAEAEVMRFVDREPDISVYKVNLEDEARRTFLCRSILDEAIEHISRTDGG
ncbi:DNA polymerase III subunit alpha, putative [Babesia caballi]|uniref:DNA polymerase III subunit alpha, putative n=1 Tax=Babesia caballi TaxID=5871 RepID=A0AAV4LX18_BABCB|nr:DNA polymerase III subunit alpha, putative [Babesia caballi]